jgi:hypothetical protein
MGEVVNGMSLFRAEAIQVRDAFPSLSFLEQDGKPIVAGELELIDAEGVNRGSYFIEIHSVEEYPYRFPFVFETGRRIPRNIDWHIFEGDGHCCLKNQPEEILLCKAGITLLVFIEKEVKPYFFNQLFREKHGYFLLERSHGLLGELEFFIDLFKTKDLLTLYELMSFVAKRIEPGRTENCFCGSKEKYRRCHREAYRTIIKFTDEELRYFIMQLANSNIFKQLYPMQAMLASGRK